MQATKFIWQDGKLIPWENATVHVMSHALHYGSAMFEGIRVYETPEGPCFFRLPCHIRRLFDSAKMYYMDMPYSQEEITQACHEVVRENGLTSAYVRPIVFRGYGTISVNPLNSPVKASIAAINWGAYLGEEGLEQGVDVCVSSWNRVAPNTIPAMAKAAGGYLSSQLIHMEALRQGFAEGIGLSTDGMVSEGAGENMFIIRDNQILTPPAGGSILAGITRDTIMHLAQDLGLTLKEQPVPREMLYMADEIFFTGTAAEVTPIRSVDRISVGEGKRGPITTRIQADFFGLFNGKTPDKHGWLQKLAPKSSDETKHPV